MAEEVFQLIREGAGRVEQVLSQLSRSTPEIVGTFLSTRDGLPVANTLPTNVDKDTISAVGPAVFSLASQTLRQIGMEQLDQVWLQSDLGHLLLMQVNPEVVLGVLTKPNPTLGAVLLAVRGAVKALQNLMDEGVGL